MILLTNIDNTKQVIKKIC